MRYQMAMLDSIRKSRQQARSHIGFSVLARDERRRNTVLGSTWDEPGVMKSGRNTSASGIGIQKWLHDLAV